MLACRWGGILICPLFPILLSEIPGNLFSELVVLNTWFKKVYAGTNQRLVSSWEKFVETLLEFSEGAAVAALKILCERKPFSHFPCFKKKKNENFIKLPEN
jgi:hypothetical protein